MPVISVARDYLFKELGQTYTDDQFRDLCFAFGIELDAITSEKEEKTKETGVVAADVSDEIIFKIDIPANRYDLLCGEGLIRALRIFLGKDKDLPDYHLIKPRTADSHPLKMRIHPETKTVRPIVLCAVLRDVNLTQRAYDSFIDLQDKLHQGIGRRRTLVSIGTHDLDTIEGPFSYEALPPKDIKFKPLNGDKEMNCIELFDFIENHPSKKMAHLAPYLSIISKSPVYPVIYDKNRVVLSLPPIINSDHSKISVKTKNIFIELTATDLTKAHITLNTIIAMFSQYCSEKFSVEGVEVYNGEHLEITPALTVRKASSSITYINKSLALALTKAEINEHLRKMGLKPIDCGEARVEVEVPITRSDILHACDLMEDVAISYGFNNLKRTLPKSVTIGKQLPINKLTDLLRIECASACYTEILTFSLVSKEENFSFLRKPDDGSSVIIANPATTDFQICRTSLLPGMLKTLFHSKSVALPLRLFEISDVVHKSTKTDTGAANTRHVCLAYTAAKSSGFEFIHGMVERLLALLPIPRCTKLGEFGYYIKASAEPFYLQGRGADLYIGSEKVGNFGILHPEVLAKFDLETPVSVAELNLELLNSLIPRL